MCCAIAVMKNSDGELLPPICLWIRWAIVHSCSFRLYFSPWTVALRGARALSPPVALEVMDARQ